LEKTEIKSRFEKVKAWAGPIFVLVMLIAALWFLHLELKEYSLQQFKEGLLGIPARKLLLAIFLTLLNYAILVCYDWLGIWYIRHPMKFGRVALASFLGYSVGNNFGLLFGGSTIRYRLYSTWGLSAAEIVTLLFILAITFWIGLFALSGVVFLIDPLPIPEAIRLPMKTTRPLGWILTALAAGYLIASGLGKPIRVGRKKFSPPPLGLSVAQYLVAAVDLLVAAGIVYVLLPESIEISYFRFVGIFLLAQVAVFVTQVPGGLGVLELCLITLLSPSSEAEPRLFAALMAYRLIFYLTPMVIGIVMLAAHEVIMQREHLKKAFGTLGVWTPDIAPRITAVVVFFAGVFVLFAAALPVEDERMARLYQLLPLWLIEFNYLMSGVFGVLLLLLSRGLYRRIQTAWVLVLPTLVASIWFSLFGSLGYWQVVILGLAFLVVAPVRHYFHRRGKLLTEQIAYHWLIAISVVLLLSLWLFWLAYKQRQDLGWDIHQIALHADAPRSLRALLAALGMAAGFYVVRILQISIGRPESTTHAELQTAQAIVSRSDRPSACLALQGDKRLLFNKEKSAVVAYDRHGKSCVALGNPIGPTDEAFQMAWDFGELCQQQSLWPVFYLVDNRFAALYQEMNLKLFHVGDQALVDLQSQDPADGEASPLHDAWRQCREAGYHFTVVDGDELAALIPVLDRIDEAWLGDRGGGPLRYSISYFSPEAIKRNPVGIVEQEGRICAFLTLWQGIDHDEFAVGMIRYLPETASGILDYMFVEAISWGRQRGYRFMDLGEAPLADWHSDDHIQMRSQLMSLAFRFGRHFYSYQGLRNYKDRFQPVWNPVYVAWPPDKPLETVLSDISRLIGSSDTEPKKKILP
jgi:phosphatidylglycerol lysyltransferase